MELKKELHTALDWSFDRLSEDDQILLTQLSFFREGFDWFPEI